MGDEGVMIGWMWIEAGRGGNEGHARRHNEAYKRRKDIDRLVYLWMMFASYSLQIP